MVTFDAQYSATLALVRQFDTNHLAMQLFDKANAKRYQDHADDFFAQHKGRSQYTVVHVITDTHDNSTNDTHVPQLSHHSVPFAQIVQSLNSTCGTWAPCNQLVT